MSYRPYPDTARALTQLQRHRVARLCPACLHPVAHHTEEDGARVCTRGPGRRISCRDCAEHQARVPVVSALAQFARAFNTPLGGLPPTWVIAPRPVGQGIAHQVALAHALDRGEHVHSVSARGDERCHGGADHCRTPRAEEAR